MSKTTAFLLGVSVWLLLAIGVFVGEHHERSKPKSADTIHSVVYDTIRYRMPIAHDSVVIRYSNKYVTVSDTVTDTITVHAGDSIPVTIPIIQKMYRNSMYEAWISGYEVKLDSINVFSKTVTKTVSQPVPKTKHWGLGINAGYGYTKGGFSPYIGIGIQYSFINF